MLHRTRGSDDLAHLNQGTHFNIGARWREQIATHRRRHRSEDHRMFADICGKLGQTQSSFHFLDPNAAAFFHLINLDFVTERYEKGSSR